MIRHLIATALASVAVPAAAQVTVDAPMGSGAVVQHDAPIAVAGSAPAGASVVARLGPAQARGRAGADGRFDLALPPLPPGGPYRLEVTSGDATAAAEDIHVGEVWLCSGQSNMELPVSRALAAPSEIAMSADSGLRLLTVAHGVADAPRLRLADRPDWAVATPASVKDFSAVCYFMGRALRRATGHAVGLIDASWGGSRIRPWMPVEAVAALGTDAPDLALLAAYRAEPAAALRDSAANWERWWIEGTRRPRSEAPWVAPDSYAWQPVPRIAGWERWGVAELSDFNGTVWFRRDVTLTAEQAGGDAQLNLGILDEMDAVWVNGEPLATGFGWSDPRSYRIAAGRLRAGDNRILVAVNDSYGDGGFHGPAEMLGLDTAAGTVALGEGWRWMIQAPDLGAAPRSPWESHAGIAGMYNAMIAPLGRIGLAGVAWYQGEADVGVPGYAERLGAMMHGWREQFGAPDLPFLIVSLAGFGDPAPQPVESDTAALRDAQRIAAARDPHAALVTAADLGDRSDIHPANKQEVGARLARAARALAYREPLSPSGPEAVRAVRDGDDVRIEVRGATGALAAWSAASPIGFERCGAAAGSCRFATARIEDGGIRVLGDGRPTERIRYGWADTPVLNLYDTVPLPLGPFELMVTP